MRNIGVIAWFLLLPASLSAQPFELAPAFSRLQVQRPVALVEAASGRRYVVEQAGRIVTFTGDGGDAGVFVDLRDRVDDGPSEAGLLGMALAPDFAASGQVILSYTAGGSPLTSVVARYTSRDGGLTLEPGSEQRLLTLAQPFGNHNGGQVAFGPDGYLYIGFGDGGSGGDPQGNGQNPHTLLGTILRIDVGGGDPYAIPPDNPFVAGGGRPEVYAFGLRNPWRWSFDRATGRLWAGDVGQGRWEEIDIIEKGGNYGWAIREGSRCYRQAPCREEGLVAPVAEYDHTRGCSVTGGYVYRGQAIPDLQGTYLYGDFCSGRIWGLDADAPAAAPQRLADSDLRITSFAEDRAGELYLLGYDGRVVKLVPSAP
jgi:glucose/arabinose dehydrogenase